MKKIYQTPNTKVFKLRIKRSLMASSTVGFGESVEDASGAESRGGGYWDEEEEW